VKVLVIGTGGREHALVWALSRDPEVDQVVAAPGNPGIDALQPAYDGQTIVCRPVDISDHDAVVALATELGSDLVVVGPEAPLVAGLADPLRAAGIAVFGPSKDAAQIEGSKAFAKDVMAAASVPTGRAYVCTTPEQAAEAIDAFGPPYVVKDDALAAGKGVVVTSDRAEALEHAAGCEQVLIEEFLDGPEVSLFAITDGRTVLPMQPAQDFKRLGDNDEGPNTGGMGAYSPLPWAAPDLVDNIVTTCVQPVVDEMRRRDNPFTGLLYAGLAMTSTGPQVIEFNCRFGDPETQSVISLLRSPLAGLFMAAAVGKLDTHARLEWSEGYAVTVVIAAEGYPGRPRTGDVIGGTEAEGVLHAGTRRREDGAIVSTGGRVLSVVGHGATLADARTDAYQRVSGVHLTGSHHRTDIALKAANGDITTP
jgi:phosphoribosylamine--glycine ligase